MHVVEPGLPGWRRNKKARHCRAFCVSMHCHQSSTRNTAPGFSTLLPDRLFNDNSAFNGIP